MSDLKHMLTSFCHIDIPNFPPLMPHLSGRIVSVVQSCFRFYCIDARNVEKNVD